MARGSLSSLTKFFKDKRCGFLGVEHLAFEEGIDLALDATRRQFFIGVDPVKHASRQVRDASERVFLGRVLVCYV